jgi:ATP-dependent Clp protease adaptor protein ClpS
MADWEDDEDEFGGGQTGIATETKKRVQKPPRFKVLLHNDDYTSMEFVVMILKAVFHKSDEDAFKIMYAVHNAGVGVAGVYPFEIAEAKVNKTIELARASEFPLLCTLEEE